MKTKRYARIQEVWSYLCLIAAIPGFLFMIYAKYEGYGDVEWILAVAALFALGLMLLMGYIKLSRGRAVWSGETWFWVFSLTYNFLLLYFYGYEVWNYYDKAFRIIMVLPLFSAVVSVLGLRKAIG